MLKEIIIQTPTFAWVILGILIVRGVKLKNEAELHIVKMLIVPVIFIIWGLEKLVTTFTHTGIDLIVYLIAALFGFALGYMIYTRKRKLYYKNETIYRSGSYVPLLIMMINFLVKYILNVYMAIQSELYRDMTFNMTYSVLCGLSVGLFIGGIYQAYHAKQDLLSKRAQSSLI